MDKADTIFPRPNATLLGQEPGGESGPHRRYPRKEVHMDQVKTKVADMKLGDIKTVDNIRTVI